MNLKLLNQLNELEKESQSRGIPILGKEKGKWLLEQIQRLKPQKILELGTANGYSGIILGSEGGELTTIDQDAKITEEAIGNYAQFSINGKIILGDAVKIVKDLPTNSFNLIFIDFYKKGYLQVLENCIRLLKNNGTLIADNISKEDCQDFKEAILKHPKLKTEIVNIKDGLSISEKIN